MTNLQDFICKTAIPCDTPVSATILRLWDAETLELLSQQLAPMAPTSEMSQLEFFQFRLAFYLRHFRANRPCRPPHLMIEAWQAAGWPFLDPDDTWPDDLHLWTTAAVTERCIENVGLILSRADDPLDLVQRAGFADVDDCLCWASKLPHANLLDVGHATLDELLYRIERGK